MTRELIDIDGVQRHLRRVGAGPGILVCGPEASSSAVLADFCGALADHGSVLSVDPPGYGLSGGDPNASIASQAHSLSGLLDVLGVRRIAIVGIEGGASVAAELAHRHPERATVLVLVNPVLLDLGERRALRERGAPPRAARRDGSHLIAHWMQRRAELIYRPWWSATHGRRRNVDLRGSDAISLDQHQAVLDRLEAGPDWGAAIYALAEHDPGQALAALTVPVHVVGGAEGGLSADVWRTSGPMRRAACHAAAVATIIAQSSGADVPDAAPCSVPGTARRLELAASRAGQLLVRRSGRSAIPRRRPLVMLHASPVDGTGLNRLAGALAAHGEVLVFDTLGNGHSDKPDPLIRPEFRTPQIGDYAQTMCDALDDLRLDSCDLYGQHTGAVIACELARLNPSRVGRVVLDGLPMFTPAFTDELLREYFVDLTPHWDGTHLQRAWSMTLDAELWFPWYAREPAARYGTGDGDPIRAHEWFMGLARSGTTYPLAYAAAFVYPTAERVAGLTMPVAVCDRPGDMLQPYSALAVTRLQQGRLLTITDDPKTDAGSISDFLAQA